MPKAIPTPSSNGHHGGGSGHQATAGMLRPVLAEPWGTGTVALGSGTSGVNLEHAFQTADLPDPAEMERLIAENVQLRERLANSRHDANLGSSEQAQAWAHQQKEYESLLDEKSELIRSLHLRSQELEASRPTAPPTPREEELLALNEELERERCKLEQDRRQLDEDLRQFREDEQIMTQQMRDMEVQMARERAELARQRNDLQRLLDEIRHELQRAERDRVLNERLLSLRGRFQDMDQCRSGPSSPPPPHQLVTAPAEPIAGDPEPRRRDSGFFRRLFGTGDA